MGDGVAEQVRESVGGVAGQRPVQGDVGQGCRRRCGVRPARPVSAAVAAGARSVAALFPLVR